MYGRHFQSMYTGSMYGQGFGLFAVWGYVISHERGGTVELNPNLLSDLFGEPLESVSTIVNKLCSPDDDSRSKAQEGRRLVKIGQFAYQVVNAAEYAKIASEADRRCYLAKKQREHRKRQHASTPVNKTSITVNKNIPLDSYSYSNIDSNSEAEADKEPSNIRCVIRTTWNLQDVKHACILNQIPESNAQSYYDQYNSQNWCKANGQPITNLQSHIAKRWNKKKQCWDFDESKHETKSALRHDSRGVPICLRCGKPTDVTNLAGVCPKCQMK